MVSLGSVCLTIRLAAVPLNRCSTVEKCQDSIDHPHSSSSHRATSYTATSHFSRQPTNSSFSLLGRVLQRPSAESCKVLNSSPPPYGDSLTLEVRFRAPVMPRNWIRSRIVALRQQSSRQTEIESVGFALIIEKGVLECCIYMAHPSPLSCHDLQTPIDTKLGLRLGLYSKAIQAVVQTSWV